MDNDKNWPTYTWNLFTGKHLYFPSSVTVIAPGAFLDFWPTIILYMFHIFYIDTEIENYGMVHG